VRDGLAGVQTEPHPKGQVRTLAGVPLCGAQDGYRAVQCLPRRLEHDVEVVALGFDLRAAGALDGSADELSVLRDELARRGVPAALDEGRVVAQIGEQEGQRARRTDHIGDALPIRPLLDAHSDTGPQGRSASSYSASVHAHTTAGRHRSRLSRQRKRSR
jgi:hypothetical protein